MKHLVHGYTVDIIKTEMKEKMGQILYHENIVFDAKRHIKFLQGICPHTKTNNIGNLKVCTICYHNFA